jgi:hypothetical protein
MRQFRFRIRTIMISIAAIAVLMVPVRIALDNPANLWILLGIVAVFGPRLGSRVVRIAVDWIAGKQHYHGRACRRW